MPDEQPPTGPLPADGRIDQDPLVLYSQALHDYTLRLWAESRRASEQRQRQYQYHAARGQPLGAQAQAQEPKAATQDQSKSSTTDSGGR